MGELLGDRACVVPNWVRTRNGLSFILIPWIAGFTTVLLDWVTTAPTRVIWFDVKRYFAFSCLVITCTRGIRQHISILEAPSDGESFHGREIHGEENLALKAPTRESISSLDRWGDVVLYPLRVDPVMDFGQSFVLSSRFKRYPYLISDFRFWSLRFHRGSSSGYSDVV